MPGVRYLKKGSTLSLPIGYDKAEELQAVGRTDADLAEIRLNAVALFGR